MKKSEHWTRRFCLTAISIAIIPIVVVVLAGLLSGVTFKKRAMQYSVSTVTINNETFTVELATTPSQQRLGLMFRKHLPEREGMLFIFKRPEIRRFWMRNTFVPLDIIFIDADRKIINIATMPPLTDQTCRSTRPALYVLEINAGEARRFSIGPGLEVKFDLRAEVGSQRQSRVTVDRKAG